MATKVKETSYQAYQTVLPSLENLRATILKSMRQGRLYTFRELALESGLQEAQVWKRLSEMRDVDKTIVEGGKTRCKYTGRLMTAYKKT